MKNNKKEKNRTMENLLSKELRLLGLTRTEAAEKLGVTTATLSYWCTGKHPIPAEGIKILMELGVTKQARNNPSKEV